MKVATGVGLLVRNIIDASEVGMTLVGGTINDNGGLLEGSSKPDGLISDELLCTLVMLVVKLVAELDKLVVELDRLVVELVLESGRLVVELDRLVVELETKGVEEMTSVTVAVASMLISSTS